MSQEGYASWDVHSISSTNILTNETWSSRKNNMKLIYIYSEKLSTLKKVCCNFKPSEYLYISFSFLSQQLDFN